MSKKQGNTSPKRMVNTFLIRSWLIFPAIQERFIKKVISLKGLDKPDAVIFDLEDSVANTPEAKKKARDKLTYYLYHNDSYKKEIYENFIVGIRINNNGYTKEDIEAVKKIQPHFLIIPKVETSKQVKHYQNHLSGIQICAIIETLPGYENRNEIAHTLVPHNILAIGYEDLSAALGIEKPDDFSQANPLIHIINSCIIAAKKFHVILKDGPSRKYGSKKNLVDFKKECLLSLSMGFQSKVAIHPTQVRIINMVFSKERLKKRAKEVIKKFQSLRNGTFVIATENNQMLDKPSFDLYLRTLNLLKK